MSLNSIGLLVFLFLNWHVAWFTISCFRCTAKWLFTHITHVYIWLFSDSFIGCYKILGIVLCAISRYLLATFVSFLASLHGMWDHSSLCVCVCVCVCVCTLVMSASAATWRTTRFLCLWNIPGRNTGMVAVSYTRDSSWPRDQMCVSCIGRRILLPLHHLGSPHSSLTRDQTRIPCSGSAEP